MIPSQRLFPLFQWLRYWMLREDRHCLHSPFLYKIYSDLLQYYRQYLKSSPPLLQGHTTPHIKNAVLLQYFQQLRPEEKVISLKNAGLPQAYLNIRATLTQDHIVIIHDIHQSRAQQKVWHQIQKGPEVQISLEFYNCGVLFFEKLSSTPMHYILKY